MTECQGNHKTRPVSERLPGQVAQGGWAGSLAPARWLGLSAAGELDPLCLLTAKPLPTGQAGCPVPEQTRSGPSTLSRNRFLREPKAHPFLCWPSPLPHTLEMCSQPLNASGMFTGWGWGSD